MSRPRDATYDFAIVGAGVAGITVARALRSSGARVVLIESGGAEADASIQALSQVEASGDLPAAHYDAHSQRLFGGTSNVWAGYCTVLERRSFLAGGWPIDYDELFRHYAAAAEILDLPEAAVQHHTLPLRGSDDVVYKPFFVSPTRFGHKYFDELAAHPDADLLLRHTVTELACERGRVTAAAVVHADTGRSLRVRARAFVLAAGGLGNPRVLLASGPLPLPAAGHYLMEHPHLSNAGFLELDADAIGPSLAGASGERHHALQLSDTACIEHGVPSLSAQFRANPGVAPLLGRPSSVLTSSAFLRSEMLPARVNRFAASPRTHGYVHLRLPDRASIEKPWRLLGERLLRAGIGRLSPLARDVRVKGGGHFLGTTRMGASDADSVVDGDARVHGTANLYVAGSSVFPYGGVANPTFTIVALAVRLGRHLEERT